MQAPVWHDCARLTCTPLPPPPRCMTLHRCAPAGRGCSAGWRAASQEGLPLPQVQVLEEVLRVLRCRRGLLLYLQVRALPVVLATRACSCLHRTPHQVAPCLCGTCTGHASRQHRACCHSRHGMQAGYAPAQGLRCSSHGAVGPGTSAPRTPAASSATPRCTAIHMLHLSQVRELP